MGGASVGRSFVSVRSTLPHEVKVEISEAWVVGFQSGISRSLLLKVPPRIVRKYTLTGKNGHSSTAERFSLIAIRIFILI